MRDHREGADPTVRIPINLGPIGERLKLGTARRERRGITVATSTAAKRKAKRKAAAESRRRNR